MWTYRQSDGELSHDGTVVGTGYAGMPPDGKNNPDAQEIHDVGPLPRGTYTILESRMDPKLGPCAMQLAPDPDNEMFGRSGFFMHADSAAHPGRASEGCIVLSMKLLGLVSVSQDRRLEVVR